MKQIECPISGLALHVNKKKTNIRETDKLLTYKYKQFILVVWHRHHRPFFRVYGEARGMHFLLYNSVTWPHLSSVPEIVKHGRDYIYLDINFLTYRLGQCVLNSVKI